MLADQFPTQEPVFAAKLTELGGNPGDNSTNVNSAIGVGNLAAKANVDFAHTDGANRLGNEPGSSGEPYSDYTGYAPLNPPMIGALPARPDSIVEPARRQPLPYLNGTTPATPQFIYRSSVGQGEAVRADFGQPVPPASAAAVAGISGSGQTCRGRTGQSDSGSHGDCRVLGRWAQVRTAPGPLGSVCSVRGCA